MITLKQFYMSRDMIYRAMLTEELKANAQVTVDRVNALLEEALRGGVTLEMHPGNHSLVSSGWRPPTVNAKTAGAAPKSKHMTCQALDVYDPDGDLDDWCMDHLEQLEAIGLWLEHPSATKGWCHLQTLPPRSGKRVFYP
jgi:hypothetical protein